MPTQEELNAEREARLAAERKNVELLQALQKMRIEFATWQRSERERREQDRKLIVYMTRELERKTTTQSKAHQETTSEVKVLQAQVDQQTSATDRPTTSAATPISMEMEEAEEETETDDDKTYEKLIPSQYVSPINDVPKQLTEIMKQSSIYRQALSLRRKPTPLTVEDLAKYDKFEAFSAAELYDSLVKLGMSKFENKGTDINMFTGIRFQVEYPVVIGDVNSETAGATLILHAIEEDIYTEDTKFVRTCVHMTEDKPLPINWKKDFQTFLDDGSVSKNQLAQVMGLDVSEINALKKDVVQKMARCMVGSNRITRFVKLWCTYLVLNDAETKMPVSVEANIIPLNYNATNISQISQILCDDDNSTVLYLDRIDNIQPQLLALAVLPFPSIELIIKGKVPLFGRFCIPGEIKANGRVYIIYKQGDFVEPFKSVDVYDMYTLIRTYAQFTKSYEDCLLGYCIALSLYTSSSLPTFSLPNARCLTDLFAPCLKEVNELDLPPVKVDRMALLGAYTVNRQTMLMLKDILSHSYDPVCYSKIIASFSSLSTRRAMYTMAKDKLFSNAFNINYYIDPLVCLLKDDNAPIFRSCYFDHYWSVCKIDWIPTHSFMHYTIIGTWSTLLEYRRQPKSVKKEIVATWAALGIIQYAVTPLAASLDIKQVSKNERYIELISKISPGPMTVHLGNIRSTYKCIKTVDKKDWVTLPKHVIT